MRLQDLAEMDVREQVHQVRPQIAAGCPVFAEAAGFAAPCIHDRPCFTLVSLQSLHTSKARTASQPGRPLLQQTLSHSLSLNSQVQEYFGDWVALEGHHFLVPLPRPHLALQPFAWDFGNSSDAIARMTEGVAALMLSLRRRFLVRCVSRCGLWGWEAGRGACVTNASVGWRLGRLPCSAAVVGHAGCVRWLGGPSPRLAVQWVVLGGCHPPHRMASSLCRSYQRGSEICERFAQSLHHLTAIEERELFDFGRCA